MGLYLRLREVCARLYAEKLAKKPGREQRCVWRSRDGCAIGYGWRTLVISAVVFEACLNLVAR